MSTQAWIILILVAFIINYAAGLFMVGLYVFNYVTGIILYAWNRRGL